MEGTRNSDYRTENEPSYELPQFSFNPSLEDTARPASLVYRPGYQRISSMGEIDTQYHGANSPENKPEGVGDPFAESGLAIAHAGTRFRNNSERDPSDERKEADSTPNSASFLLSPSSTRVDGNDSTEFSSGFQHSRVPSNTSSVHQPYEATPDTEQLTPSTPSFVTKSYDNNSFYPPSHCKAKQTFEQGRGHWLPICILVLAVYSTIFSGIWVVLAIRRPRYNHLVSSHGHLSPNTASLLTAAFAKSIELSFVTVFVAFLGQILSRRALAKASPGISIAEMMGFRSWIVQPGTLITQWKSVRHAGGSFLGAIALTAAAVAILYTTASESLVSPQLRLGATDHRFIYGLVAAEFANPTYIHDNCPTPISETADPTDGGPTCIQIAHAGQGYQNYMQYLAIWANDIATGTGSDVLANRPKPVGTLYDNTTVQGSWINPQNMTELSEQYGRTVINVSMAMPHSGVFAAARQPVNNILQPQDLDGMGRYDIEASVPSPVVNVLCASVSEKDIAPLVYNEWPNKNATGFNSSLWPACPDIPTGPDWHNSTVVDDLFGFGVAKYNRIPPIFPKLPLAYNTVLNDTGIYAHTDALYMLAASPTSDYMLCSMSVSLTPNCSTTYTATVSGGNLTSNCDDPDNPLTYGKSQPNATNGLRNRDWVNVATDWALALSLNAGITDSKSANARLLTQLIPTAPSLDVSLPSIAEALAVLAADTLLMSSSNAPFIHFWNYSTTVTILEEPQLQAFNATFRFADYASGGNRPWQGVFYIVLVLVFLTNVICLIHFTVRRGLVTDFVEPQNLFALSLNSPPSKALAGSCGGGPAGAELNVRWHINHDSGHLFIENRNAAITQTSNGPSPRSDMNDSESIVASTYSRLSAKKVSLI